MLDRMNLYRPVIIVLLVVSGIGAGASYFFVALPVFATVAGVWLAVALWAALQCARIGRDTKRQLACGNPYTAPGRNRWELTRWPP